MEEKKSIVKFTIDETDKVVYVRMDLRLSKKDETIISNFEKRGYSVEYSYKAPEKKQKGIFQKAKVLEYLEKNGTQEQIAEFNKKMNEPCLDKNGKPIYRADGKTPKTKGYMNALQYFKKTFKDYK